MTASSSVASSAPASMEAEISAAVLRPIMSKYSSTVIGASRRRRGDVDVLALAQHHARGVVEAHQPQDLGVAEAEVGEAVQRDPAEAEDQVAGVDRLGHAVERPQRGAVAALDVPVLDVVVDQAEVVAQLHGRRAREGAGVLAGDARVGEEAQERAHALAARSVRPVQPEVVPDHLVDADRRFVPVADDAQDLRLGVGEELAQVDVVGHGHGAGSVAGLGRNVFAESSLLTGGWTVTPARRVPGSPSRPDPSPEEAD